MYGWEIAHEPPGYYNPWNNWRIGSFPENTNLAVGIASTGNVLDIYRPGMETQGWSGHRDIRCCWLTPATHPNGQIGQWSNTNATSSGLTNLENVRHLLGLELPHNTNEEIDVVKGWTFNTSNSNYSAY